MRMKQLEPVIWSKGTFLSPQHLQHQDRFLEDLAQFHVESFVFRPWGFRTLEISHAALASGTFGITRASGVFSDGLLFDFPGGDTAPDAKPLADCFVRDRDTVELYLAVPQFHDRGVNLAAHDGGARYRAEVQVLPDENTGVSEKPVQVARKNLRLLTGGDPPEGYVSLRVARICRTAAGLFEIDPRFVPPLVDFSASDYLMSIARRLVEVLSARSGTIAGVRRQRNQSLADFTSSDIANFWLLYTINTALPVLRHLFERRLGHPEHLFTAMLRLAGALTTFSPDLHPRDFPQYDHDKLGSCFAALDAQLRRLLDTVVPTHFVALPLIPTRNAIYSASIDDDQYLGNTRMYLAVRADASPAEVIARVPQLVKVTSLDQVEHLVRQALPGVALTHVASPPNVVPVKLDYQYFSIGRHGTAWEAVPRARNLAAYVPVGLPAPQLELLIILPQPISGGASHVSL